MHLWLSFIIIESAFTHFGLALLLGESTHQVSKPATYTKVNCTVTPDWLDLLCGEQWEDIVTHEAHITVNALDGSKHPLRPSFSKYHPYHGELKLYDYVHIDFMGLQVPHKLFCTRAYMAEPDAQALHTRQCKIFDSLVKQNEHDPVQYFYSKWPVVSAEFFEYVQVLDAVSDYVEKGENRPFVFMEVGAGYGHWTFTAHKALMQKMSNPSYKYVLIDVVGELESEIQKLCHLNDIYITKTKDSPVQFHHGFVGGGTARMTKEQHAAFIPMWGLLPDPNSKPGPKISIVSVFELYDLPCVVDMVDIDIQGSEYAIFFDDNATIELLTIRVRRVHIATHQLDRDKDIVELFRQHGWKELFRFPNGGDTWYGPVKFTDGVLSFVNPRPISCEKHFDNLVSIGPYI